MAPKMSRKQSLWLAQVPRIGGVVLSKAMSADGTLTVTWRIRGGSTVMTDTIRREYA